MSLQLVHGLLGILPVHEGNKRKSTGLHRLLILREVHTANPSKRLEELLQICLSGILGNIRNTNSILIAIVILATSRPTTLGSGRGHGSEGLAPHRAGSTTCRGGNVLASPGAAADAHHGPSIVGPCGLPGLVPIHIVLALQIPHVLFGPERVQVSGDGFAHVLLLQIDIGVGILNENIITTLNGHIGLILVHGRLTKLLPLATSSNSNVFGHLIVRNTDFRGRFQKSTLIGRISAVGCHDFDSLGVDARGVCGGNGDFVTRCCFGRLCFIRSGGCASFGGGGGFFFDAGFGFIVGGVGIISPSGFFCWCHGYCFCLSL
mmetsp:Transcript_28532/g.51556  ORF Transcript_28532/g.51556 Transcript_28532/m.51556 type:complete len:319 (+) Transcript_28532:333-1289(+)